MPFGATMGTIRLDSGAASRVEARKAAHIGLTLSLRQRGLRQGTEPHLHAAQRPVRPVVPRERLHLLLPIAEQVRGIKGIPVLFDGNAPRMANFVAPELGDGAIMRPTAHRHARTKDRPEEHHPAFVSAEERDQTRYARRGAEQQAQTRVELHGPVDFRGLPHGQSCQHQRRENRNLDQHDEQEAHTVVHAEENEALRHLRGANRHENAADGDHRQQSEKPAERMGRRFLSNWTMGQNRPNTLALVSALMSGPPTAIAADRLHGADNFIRTRSGTAQPVEWGGG